MYKKVLGSQSAVTPRQSHPMSIAKCVSCYVDGARPRWTAVKFDSSLGLLMVKFPMTILALIHTFSCRPMGSSKPLTITYGTEV